MASIDNRAQLAVEIGWVSNYRSQIEWCLGASCTQHGKKRSTVLGASEKGKKRCRRKRRCCKRKGPEPSRPPLPVPRPTHPPPPLYPSHVPRTMPLLPL